MRINTYARYKNIYRIPGSFFIQRKKQRKAEVNLK